MDAGKAAEGIHAKAGIIREYGSRHSGAVMESLLARVFLKSEAILNASQEMLNTGERFDEYSVRSSRILELA
jgi:hypothetical protein